MQINHVFNTSCKTIDVFVLNKSCFQLKCSPFYFAIIWLHIDTLFFIIHHIFNTIQNYLRIYNSKIYYQILNISFNYRDH